MFIVLGVVAIGGLFAWRYFFYSPDISIHDAVKKAVRDTAAYRELSKEQKNIYDLAIEQIIRISLVDSTIRIFEIKHGRYPLTLNELSELLAESHDDSTSLIDPATGKEFFYKSDGLSYKLCNMKIADAGITDIYECTNKANPEAEATFSETITP